MADTPTVGLVYCSATVSRILGLHCACSDPVTQPADGEIVVYYGGWELKQLRTCAAGRKRMWQDQDWYEKYRWEAEPGYYRLLLPVLNSNRQNWNEQVTHLSTIDETWLPAPITVAATAVLVHLVQNGKDLMQNDWCRCGEPLPGARRAALAVDEGRVGVDGRVWDDDRDGRLWLAASRFATTRKP